MTKYYKMILATDSGWYGPNGSIELRVNCDNGSGQPLSPGPTFNVEHEQVVKCSDAIAQPLLEGLADENTSDPYFEVVEGPSYDVDYDAIREAFLNP